METSIIRIFVENDGDSNPHLIALYIIQIINRVRMVPATILENKYCLYSGEASLNSLIAIFISFCELKTIFAKSISNCLYTFKSNGEAIIRKISKLKPLIIPANKLKKAKVYKMVLKLTIIII